MARLSRTLHWRSIVAYILACSLHVAHSQFIWSSLVRPAAGGRSWGGSGLLPGIGVTPAAQTGSTNGAATAPGTAGLGSLLNSTANLLFPTTTISRTNCLVYQVQPCKLPSCGSCMHCGKLLLQLRMPTAGATAWTASVHKRPEGYLVKLPLSGSGH